MCRSEGESLWRDHYELNIQLLREITRRSIFEKRIKEASRRFPEDIESNKKVEVNEERTRGSWKYVECRPDPHDVTSCLDYTSINLVTEG